MAGCPDEGLVSKDQLVDAIKRANRQESAASRQQREHEMPAASSAPVAVGDGRGGPVSWRPGS
jgi:hypothetical protein